MLNENRVLNSIQQSLAASPSGFPEGATLLAIKGCREAHMSIVLADRSSATRTEYVTWMYNASIGGCGCGHYFGSYEAALNDFNRRC